MFCFQLLSLCFDMPPYTIILPSSHYNKREISSDSSPDAALGLSTFRLEKFNAGTEVAMPARLARLATLNHEPYISLEDTSQIQIVFWSGYTSNDERV